ncbi:MAG: hypothetical protein PF518_01145 [Spirochaetaceae bacterium]|jgi:hypothetical protein|nr:hypothetical protein [Spirochaetaceae bacterium]
MSSIAEKEQTKRDLKSIGIALLIHLIIFGVFIGYSFLFSTDVDEYRGPVLVKLGRSNAPDIVTEKLPVMPESTEEQQSSTVESPGETTEEIKSGDPQETVKVDVSESDSAIARPVSDKESGDRGTSETSTKESSATSSSANSEIISKPADEMIIVSKGVEDGNAAETTFEASSGLVGRSFGAAIYQYMPLPQFIEKRIFDSLKDDVEFENLTAVKKRGILSRYYDVYNKDEYILKGQKQPDLTSRPQIWSLLAEGGLDLKDSKYKPMGLKPLIITFMVDVGEKETTLSNIQITRSSGNGEIDEAVIYGFQQAVFSNSANIPVKGRFTYRFD